MNENEKTALRANEERLITGLSPDIDELILVLKSKDAITMVCRDELLSYKTRSERTQRLLESMSTVDNGWYLFMEALRETKRIHLADRLVLCLQLFYNATLRF